MNDGRGNILYHFWPNVVMTWRFEINQFVYYCPKFTTICWCNKHTIPNRHRTILFKVAQVKTAIIIIFYKFIMNKILIDRGKILVKPIANILTISHSTSIDN